MSSMRIGDVAKSVGTTPRTIRYYEEMGLLGDGAPREGGRAPGQHRSYSEAEVERLEQVIAMRDLLGVSLDELRALLEAQEARALLREEWEHGPAPARREPLLREALSLLDVQMEMVGERLGKLEGLRAELVERRARVLARLEEVGVVR